MRHGQTEWNRVERFRGRYDVPLNTTGLEQANRTAGRIAAWYHPAAVYSSPLVRAMDTAETIAIKCRLSALPSRGLIDIDYGMWQGLTPQEARQKWPELVANWYDHPQKVEIPGGESLALVRVRATAALDEICQLHTGQEIVLVSHTVVNRLIISAILGLGNERFWHLGQEPCAINVIEKNEKGGILVSMNDTSHL